MRLGKSKKNTLISFLTILVMLIILPITSAATSTTDIPAKSYNDMTISNKNYIYFSWDITNGFYLVNVFLLNSSQYSNWSTSTPAIPSSYKVVYLNMKSCYFEMNLDITETYHLIVYNNNTFSVILSMEYYFTTNNQIPTPVITFIFTLIVFSLCYWKYKNKK